MVLAHTFHLYNLLSIIMYSYYMLRGRLFILHMLLNFDRDWACGIEIDTDRACEYRIEVVTNQFL